MADAIILAFQAKNEEILRLQHQLQAFGTIAQVIIARHRAMKGRVEDIVRCMQKVEASPIEQERLLTAIGDINQFFEDLLQASTRAVLNLSADRAEQEV